MLRKFLAFKINTVPKFAQTLPFPFQFTLNPNEFKFIDKRFEQYPVIQKLFPNEHEHIKYVLTLFQKLINKGSSQQATHKYVDQRLIKKVQQYRNILKQLQSSSEININLEKCTESVGYLEYWGMNPQLFIHNCIVQRDDEKVRVIQREELKKIAEKTAEEQLKQDIKQIQKNNSMLQKLKEQSKTKKAFDSFFQGVLSAVQNTYQKSLNSKNFKPYFLTNKIKTTMNVAISTSENVSSNLEDIQVITKWYYEINCQEPESIRNSRKRILFDFQLWNRGCLIPVQDFSS